MIDYRDWFLVPGRRLHSLNVWYTLRSFGRSGFQAHLRKLISLARIIEELVQAEEGIELFTPRSFALVVFRLLDSSGEVERENELNQAFMKRIHDEKGSMLTETKVGGKVCVRMAVGSRETEERHIRESWDGIIRPLYSKSEGGRRQASSICFWPHSFSSH